MNKAIILRPIGMGNVTIPLICDFIDSRNSKRIVITQNYEIVRDRELRDNEKPLKYEFSPIHKEERISWNPDQEVAKDKAMNMLKIHPLISVDGNYNLKKGMFEYVDQTEEKRKKVQLIKERGIVFNMVNNMQVDEVRNIAFLNKINPVGKDLEDIYVALVDFENGILMRNPSEFRNNYNTKGMDIRVVAEKADALKVILKRDSFYYYDNIQIGKTTEDIIEFLEKNAEKFDYIKREVMKKDTLPVDYKNKTIKEALKLVPSSDEQLGLTKQAAKDKETDARKELETKAKELNIKSYHLKSFENLTKEIAEAEAKLATV